MSADLPLSLVLDYLIRHGGGQLVKARRGGLGVYERLEGCRLLRGQPIAVERARGRDGVERLYPAVIVDLPFPHTGARLLPITTAFEARRHLPGVYQALRVARLITPDEPDLVPAA